MFKEYRKKNTQPMRPYIPKESMEGISAGRGDVLEEGGMIASGGSGDLWYVSKKFFEENYELA